MNPRTYNYTKKVSSSTGFFTRIFGHCLKDPDEPEFGEYLIALDPPEWDIAEQKKASPEVLLFESIQQQVAIIYVKIETAFLGRTLEQYTAFQSWLKYINQNYSLINDNYASFNATVLCKIPELDFISLVATQKWILEKYIEKKEAKCEALKKLSNKEYKKERFKVNEVFLSETRFIEALEKIVENIQECNDKILQLRKIVLPDEEKPSIISRTLRRD